VDPGPAVCSCRNASIANGRIEGIDQADLAIHLPQQRQAAIAGEVPPLKIGDDLATVNTGEQQRLGVTLCHSNGLSAGCKNCGKSLYIQ
jgi:hypothetical protein